MRKVRYIHWGWLMMLSGIVNLFAVPAMSSEAIIYEYDALGRLVAVQNSGSANDGVDTTINYDDAGNRLSYQETGSDNAMALFHRNSELRSDTAITLAGCNDIYPANTMVGSFKSSWRCRHCKCQRSKRDMYDFESLRRTFTNSYRNKC